ncbi:MAG: thiamine pyrophosphate-dependent enzyme [Pseudomonadota bacterium]|nr:thiamine pyrophosphate-dependent enzyme [Pseudomonadota bacterium]
MTALKTARMTGGAAMVEGLLRNGVDTLFALPGVQLNHFFDAVYDKRNAIRVLNARHEQGAAYMAFGYAIATGRVGAFAVVPGPGILNTTAALSTAYGCSQPVLAITGQINAAAIDRGYGLLHEVRDQPGTLASVNKWVHRIDHPVDAPAAMDEAFRHLQGGRPRPVTVEMAMDIMGLESLVPAPESAIEVRPPEADPDLIAAAAKMLGAAKAPMIFVGSGAYHAAAKVRALAEMLQAPVVAYQNGRGILDERHYLAQVHPAGNALWAECDVALSIGCRLQPERMYWGIDDDLKVIHVDIDPTELTRVMAPTIGIVGDSALVTAALVDEVPAHNPRRASREDELTALKASTHQHLVDGLGPQMAFLEVIRDELPEDGFFVDEFTQVGYVARVGFPVYRPRTMVTPGYQGTLGYGFATALGVAAAHPDKKVISVNGDGGFMYTMPELASAVHHNLDIVAIVFADGHYGNVRRQQKLEHDGKVIASDLTNPDFVKLAESFGALGLRADGPEGLRAALKQAFKQRGPAIIEVPVGEFTEPWPFIRPPASRPAR